MIFFIVTFFTMTLGEKKAGRKCGPLEPIF